MDPQPVEISEQGLPPDVAEAWLNVLMDIWEQDEAADKQAPPTTEVDSHKPPT